MKRSQSSKRGKYDLDLLTSNKKTKCVQFSPESKRERNGLEAKLRILPPAPLHPKVQLWKEGLLGFRQAHGEVLGCKDFQGQ